MVNKFHFSCVGILSFLTISTGLLMYLSQTSLQGDFTNPIISPDGKYFILTQRHPMLFAMPGGGSDAPATVHLYDATGNQLNSKNIEMVQLIDISWLGDGVTVTPVAEKWNLPKINDINVLLFSAAYTGNQQEVEKFLAEGADINFKTELNQTLLHAAVIGNNKYIVQLFIDKGIDVNAIDKTGQTILHKAAIRGNAAMIELLIANGVDLNILDQDKINALTLAAMHGNVQAMKVLINQGANVNNDSYQSPLHSVLARWKPSKAKQEILNMLLAKGVVNKQNFLLYTIIHPDLDAAKLLLNHGVDINERDSYNQETVLMKVIRQNEMTTSLQTEFVNLFISQGIDIDAQNMDGQTALELAEKLGKSEIVKLIQQQKK